MSFWSEATESIDTFVQKTVFTAVFFIYIEGMIDIYSLAKNPLVFQKQRTITSAYIDVSGKMGIAQTVLMVQDNFTENFGSIKMDNFCVNEKGGYWAIYKAKFKFFKRKTRHFVRLGRSKFNCSPCVATAWNFNSSICCDWNEYICGTY